MSSDKPLDIACTGGHMKYCDDCKHSHRWNQVGELSAVERPDTVVIHSTVCMLTKGSRFVSVQAVS